MTRFIIFIFTLLAVSCSFLSCKKDKLLTDSSARLSFSKDSVLFDTVFTTIGSATRQIRVRNTNSQKINISSVRLAQGTSSNFIMNVDGISGKIIEHIGSMEYLFPTGRDCDTSAIVEWFNYSFSCFTDSLESYIIVPASECQNPFHVGIEQYNNYDKISLSPNPTSEKITLSFSQEQNYKISLYSILGVKLLALESVKTKTLELDLQSFAQNIYFVVVEDEAGQRIVKKIIKK